MARPQQVPPEVWANIKKDYLEGYSLRKLAAMHNVDASTINKRAKAENWLNDIAEDYVLKRAKQRDKTKSAITKTHLISPQPVINDDTSTDAVMTNTTAVEINRVDRQLFDAAVVDYAKCRRYAYVTQINAYKLVNKVLLKIDELITQTGTLQYVKSIDEKGNTQYGRITEYIKDLAPVIQSSGGVLGFTGGSNNINITNLNGEVDSAHGNVIKIELVEPKKTIIEGDVIDVGGDSAQDK